MKIKQTKKKAGGGKEYHPQDDDSNMTKEFRQQEITKDYNNESEKEENKTKNDENCNENH